jgi:hypothetical protein
VNSTRATRGTAMDALAASVSAVLGTGKSVVVSGRRRSGRTTLAKKAVAELPTVVWYHFGQRVPELCRRSGRHPAVVVLDGWAGRRLAALRNRKVFVLDDHSGPEVQVRPEASVPADYWLRQMRQESC